MSEEKEINTSTKDILGQISVGCHMAIDSTEQIVEHVSSEEFRTLILKFRDAHKEIQEDVEARMRKYGIEIPSSGVMAKAFSWMSAEIKMTLEGTDKEAAKLLMDGCNMGIQTMSEYINDNPEACDGAKQMARKLISLEEDFMREIKPYL